jgi:uncharacterized membrane protein YsdA (DUF1294 family)
MQYLLIFAIINLVGYYMMYNDKQRAIKKQWRIREAHLFTVALLGGGLGVWLGTKAPLFHKAAHWQFRLGVPLIMLAQTILFFLFLK